MFAAVKEASRETHERIDLDDYIKDQLSHKLQILEEKLQENPETEITYFKPDQKKDGGSYSTFVGTVKKIDQYRNLLIMTDATEIPIKEIIRIEGQIFNY